MLENPGIRTNPSRADNLERMKLRPHERTHGYEPSRRPELSSAADDRGSVHDISNASRASAPILLLAATVLLGCANALAANVEDLYRARTIVTGQREESRRLGFPVCLEQVLVKVSGDPRLIDDPKVAALAEEAASFVTEFAFRDRMAGIPVHDEQGTRDRPYDLTVRFDPAQIDAALRSLGREPWQGPRPRVALLVGVDIGGTTYLLASDGERGRDQREALGEAAARFGMPMALPDEAALAAAGLSYGKLQALDPRSLDAAATAIGGDLALVGDLLWSEQALGWIAEWRMDAGGKSHRWQIRGVSFDDAFRNAMAGAAQILSGHGEPSQASR